MATVRLLFLWHMHQPFYKNLVTGEYRLPWVRLHALKDYYGMVKLLEEFPDVHQTFNLVPSLLAQIQDYVSGAANDPFFEVASRPAEELDFAQKLFAIQYLFQANMDRMIGRYSRYKELWQKFRSKPEDAARLAAQLSDSDITDLQVLSQIAWMDEFFLQDPEICELVKKGRGYSREDQQLVIKKEREFLGKVLPEYASAAKRGAIEISTSPYYHPILPLVCDTDTGAQSHSGLPLPERRFRHPEDAREQIVRGMELHEKVFGIRPRGMWPSEGSVSNEVLRLACEAGLHWVATDEGVLGRSLGYLFERDGRGRLLAEPAEKLYKVYRWEQGDASMNMVFRNHSLSDLIGFVYSGMPAKEAAEDFIGRVKESAKSVLERGKDAVVSVILDGENAWETYPQSGREFLRRLYDAIQRDPQFEALTVSEALEREKSPETLKSIFPGSWINANFDVWIGAPEDNTAWDYLSDARDFYSRHEAQAPEQKRKLAHEELLIAEGSDWNWWYGPEHHSENDLDFDDLYRKHLSNVYHALGAAPPEVLAQPITGRDAKPQFTPQTAYIRPHVDGREVGYFDWLGAATHVADRHSSSMHGKLLLLDTGYAGIDEENLYCRLDFMEPVEEWSAGESTLLVSVETVAADGKPDLAYRLQATIAQGKLTVVSFSESGRKEANNNRVEAGLDSIFECKLPLELLGVAEGSTLRVRFSVWRDRLPLDVLPQEGAIDVRVVPEDELTALPYAKP
ncbi:MAG TPA: glycoside hydrolase family 57 protein [Candidatus Acidoferrales bacterium]|nr:glycoside hydrolase family 57 protein [Candidatus Acidoferrales bacterium]